MCRLHKIDLLIRNNEEKCIYLKKCLPFIVIQKFLKTRTSLKFWSVRVLNFLIKLELIRIWSIKLIIKDGAFIYI